VDDPNAFLVYEAYVDEAAMEAHLETAHFREIVQGRVNPLLESRESRTYRVIEPYLSTFRSQLRNPR
jgi:quinol monooxygenase YgiN